MSALLDSLLDYATLGRGDLELATVTLGAVLKESTETLGRRLEQTHATVRLAADGNLRADPVQLAEVLCNLIDNALKYTEREQPDIEVGLRTLQQTALG